MKSAVIHLIFPENKHIPNSKIRKGNIISSIDFYSLAKNYERKIQSNSLDLSMNKYFDTIILENLAYNSFTNNESNIINLRNEIKDSINTYLAQFYFYIIKCRNEGSINLLINYVISGDIAGYLGFNYFLYQFLFFVLAGIVGVILLIYLIFLIIYYYSYHQKTHTIHIFWIILYGMILFSYTYLAIYWERMSEFGYVNLNYQIGRIIFLSCKYGSYIVYFVLMARGWFVMNRSLGSQHFILIGVYSICMILFTIYSINYLVWVSFLLMILYLTLIIFIIKLSNQAICLLENTLNDRAANIDDMHDPAPLKSKLNFLIMNRNYTCLYLLILSIVYPTLTHFVEGWPSTIIEEILTFLLLIHHYYYLKNTKEGNMIFDEPEIGLSFVEFNEADLSSYFGHPKNTIDLYIRNPKRRTAFLMLSFSEQNEFNVFKLAIQSDKKIDSQL